MKTNICTCCFQECTEEQEQPGWDIPRPLPMPETGSDCCGADVKQVDTDLVEWHRELQLKAKETGQGWQIDYDPEAYFKPFDQGIPVAELLKEVASDWDSST